MNPIGFLLIDPAAGSVGMQIMFCSAIVVATLVVLRFYWLGRNWARILVLFGAVLSLLNLSLLGSTGVLTSLLIVIEAVFGAFMLWWLNTPRIKAYFAGARDVESRLSSASEHAPPSP